MAELEPRGVFQSGAEIAPAVDAVNRYGHAVDGPGDLGGLVDRLSDADCVLIGEASHGTSDYYRWRAHLTARLLRDHDFSFVAVEGDWTSCYGINRYVKDFPDAHPTAYGALTAFDRWPTWMWANWEVDGFLSWLHELNQDREMGDRAGFYGLDVYGLYESLQAVIDYLETVDPEAAADARDAYRCFEPYGEDAREYAQAVQFVPDSCRDEVIEVLEDLRERTEAYPEEMPDDRFAAEQNALVAANAEAYYRAMFGGDDDSWNVRDRHMMQTLSRLFDHHGSDAKGIVWAHNTHVGDARATDMPRHGRINIGQLAREDRSIGETYTVGFGSRRGSVIASDAWGDPLQTMTVPEAQRDSYEHVFHAATADNALLYSDDLPEGSALDDPRGHRAIGVVYHPARESGNYVPTVLPDRYDAFVHFEQSNALHPIERHPERERVPELYPFGL
ncbi:erythromycin esterase family protein [Haloplanus halobius]|uniref:erythromycin esterase family protein n=1 Tax=Haloplanus halobius TaxID=2934938 RepID=UPI00200E30C4|nr:erythromycin esterase family protein [Haloplanus sp. XH21]